MKSSVFGTSFAAGALSTSSVAGLNHEHDICISYTTPRRSSRAYHNYTCIHESHRRKEERSKQGQTNNKAKQQSTPKAVTFPK